MNLLRTNKGGEDSKKCIALQPWKQRHGHQTQDDWSGITDPKRRKKMQNRLNQRALRQRKRAGETPPALVQSSHTTSTELTRNLQSSSHILGLRDQFDELEKVNICKADSGSTKVIMQRLELLAYQCYYYGPPQADLLLHIIQFNFTKALIENTKVLRLCPDDMHDDATSPFNTSGPWQQHKQVEATSLPVNLQPTAVQRTVAHHPWLDLLPIPRMRDNLIKAGDSYDEEQLCRAMKSHGAIHTGKSGIVVWREPWDSSGWEVSEAFARDWAWVIRDCKELFRSTNYWRTQRGERALFKAYKD